MISTDLLVIGGGINGSGIARDAAGRGLDVLLCEREDLAQHTSSASTKLIHGGLRYLESYDFKLVRHALAEREVLLRSAPHIIWPLRFVLPHRQGLRPKWMIRIGLFLYDHIGGRKTLPASRGVNLSTHAAGGALKPDLKAGFEYSDCWVQDARLVVLNAMDAQQRGAAIYTRTACEGLERKPDRWIAQLRDQLSGQVFRVDARAVVNAAGPWVDQVLNISEQSPGTHHIRLVKGSHIVVPRLFHHDYPYIFQHADGRVLFAIPFEGDFTLLGTTDLELAKMPAKLTLSEQEASYICTAASVYFKEPIGVEDIVWSYSGVRPLFDDAAQNASKVTRDYHLRLDTKAAPILSVFGGKVTTHRRLAEEAIELLKQAGIECGSPWTAESRLPGGDFAGGDFDRFLAETTRRYPALPEALLRDYCRNYGTCISSILGKSTSVQSLGRDFGGGLYECEVRYLMTQEYALTADDVLWRRSKKGLRLPAEAVSALDQWMGRHGAAVQTGS